MWVHRHAIALSSGASHWDGCRPPLCPMLTLPVLQRQAGLASLEVERQGANRHSGLSYSEHTASELLLHKRLETSTYA
eukprot:353839-Chlamydomonas_euryale.AAC.50